MGTLSAKIRSLRGEKGLSQTELAEKLGVKRQYINNVETGHQLPSERLLLSIAEALDVSFEDLKRRLEDDKLEERIKRLGLKEPEFVLMFKDIPKMTPEEKKSLLDIYELIKLRRERRK